MYRFPCVELIMCIWSVVFASSLVSSRISTVMCVYNEITIQIMMQPLPDADIQVWACVKELGELSPLSLCDNQTNF